MKKRRVWLWAAAILVALIGFFAWVLSPPAVATGLTDANSRAAPVLAKDVAPRRLLVIGGTSGIGLETVKLALARGHTVTVMSRRGQIDLPPSPSLQLLKGDIRAASTVAQAVQGQDAVVISISVPPGGDEVTVFSEGARNVIQAMTAANTRLLVVSGIGAGDSRGHGGFGYDRVLQPLLLAENYADKERMEAIVSASAVDWTIVRPGFLIDAPARAEYRVVSEMAGVRSGSLSRADVAHYLVAAIETQLDSRQTIFLTE